MWSSTSVASKTLPRAKRHGGPWRGRVGLILLFALFFAPALLAWLLVLSGWRPASLTHHGELIQPPRPVAELVLGGAAGTDLFAGLWSLLLVVPSECGDDCRQALDGLQRVRIARNKDADFRRREGRRRRNEKVVRCRPAAWPAATGLRWRCTSSTPSSIA